MEDKLDLENLRQMLDDALEHETKESLEEWLGQEKLEKHQAYLDNQVACANMLREWALFLSEGKEYEKSEIQEISDEQILEELRQMTPEEILAIPLTGRFTGMFETFEEMGKVVS